MPFQPFNVPFTLGVNESTTSFDVSNPSMLSKASNVVFTKAGSLIGRPGLVADQALVQSTTSGGLGPTQDGNNLEGHAGSFTPAGIEANDQGIFSMYQGTGFVKSNNSYTPETPWKESGPFWSTKKYTSPALDYYNIQFQGLGVTNRDYGNQLLDSEGTSEFISYPVAIGNHVVAINTTENASHGFTITERESSDLMDTQIIGTSNFDVPGQCNVCVVNVLGDDIIVNPVSSGPLPVNNATLVYHKVNPTAIPGQGTQVNLALGNVMRLSPAGQQLWACAGNVNTAEMYIAYHTSNANVVVARIDTSTGTVTASITLGISTGSDLGVSLCHNGLLAGGGGILCVGYNDTTTNKYTTRIITITSTSVLTSASLNVLHGVGQEASPPYRPHTLGNINVNGVSKIVACYVTGTDGNRRLNVDLRDYTTTSVTTLYTLWNGSDGTSTDKYDQTAYKPYIGASTLHNRVLITVYKETYNRPPASAITPGSQWIVVDITNNISQPVFGNQPIIVASSPLLEVYTTPPVNPVVGLDYYKFGVRQGILYDGRGISALASKVIKLQSMGSRGISVNSAVVFTGTTPYIYDGIQTSPLGFPEDAPVITGITIRSASGGECTTTGSVTFQAIWQIVNGKGQIIRSAQSNIATTRTVLANKTMDIRVSVPQLTGRFLSSNHNVQIKLYSTIANPPASAPLFLVSQTEITNTIRPFGYPIIQTAPIAGGVPTAGTVLFTGIGSADTSQEQLYISGNVFDDQMPRSADRGIAFVNNRLWVADQTRVYVSKLLNSQYSTAFNLNSDRLVIEMPTSIGTIQALGNLQDKIAVIGSLGSAFIYGIGFDDLGNGTGWAVQVVPSQGVVYYPLKQTGPRVAQDIPGYGTVFIGPGAVPYLMDYSGNTKAITVSFIDEYLETTEVCYWGPGQFNQPQPGGVTTSQEHGPMILFASNDSYRLFDINSSRWATWDSINIGSVQYLSSFNGRLYMQTNDSAQVYTYTNTTGNDDDIGPITTNIVTNPISVTGATGDGAIEYAWGRLRSLTLLGSSTVGQPFTANILVTADNTTSPLISKTINFVPGVTTKWPYFNNTEIRATIQRCSRFVVKIIITPAVVELAGLEFWAWASSDRAPARLRS